MYCFGEHVFLGSRIYLGNPTVRKIVFFGHCITEGGGGGGGGESLIPGG